MADRHNLAEIEQQDFADGGASGTDAVRSRALGGDDLVCFVLCGVGDGSVVELGSEGGGGGGEGHAADGGG
jgi:hypothetical protein